MPHSPKIFCKKMDIKMRRSDREIAEFGEKAELLGRCATVRLGLKDGKYPYVVPLSFGYEVENGILNIYFHCAREGKKIGLIKADPNVCIEADIFNGYVETASGITADYESVIGFGRCEEVYGDMAVHGLELLLNHCGFSEYSAKDCLARGIVAVYKIEIREITGKRRFKKS